MEDINCSLVLILERRTHHHIIVRILIHVRHGRNAGTKSRILVAWQVFQSPVGNKSVLERKVKNEATQLISKD